MSERYVVKKGIEGLKWALDKNAMGGAVEYTCGCEWDPLHMMAISHFMEAPRVYFFRIEVKPKTLIELHKAGIATAYRRGRSARSLAGSWFWNNREEVTFGQALEEAWYAENPQGDENE